MSEALSDFGLIALTEYQAPGAPAHHVVERLRDRLSRLLGGEPGEAVQDDSLRRAGNEVLEATVHDPDFHALPALLIDAVHDWRHDSEASRVRVLVLPPCEPVDLVAELARRHAMATLDPPSRRSLLERPDQPIEEPAGDGIIVVPRLQDWFLRHPRGLERCRALLLRVGAGDRRWLIGVDAWSWRYLVRAAQADLLLPTPLVLPPFDADRLAAWLATLLDADGERVVNIRAVDEATDVFARDDEGHLSHDYLRELAAHSRGIPWVAWHLWHRGLSTMPESSDTDESLDAGPDRESGNGPREQSERGEGGDEAATCSERGTTLWVTHDADRLLPSGHETDALLVLQAVLIHGGLSRVDLELVLPMKLELEALLCALRRAGFLECHADTGLWTVLPCAYPGVRTALEEAGWSMAVL